MTYNSHKNHLYLVNREHLDPFTPKSDQFQIARNITLYIIQFEELAISPDLTRMFFCERLSFWAWAWKG